MMRRVVITGCPGAGRSALIEELRRRKHAVVGEPGRRVIAAERASNGTGLPWVDAQRFVDLAFWMAVGDHDAATGDPTFFDGSALDVAAWFARNGDAPPGPVPSYDRIVIVSPPRPEVAGPGALEHLGFDADAAAYHDLLARLSGWGYLCRILPREAPAAQADWVIKHIRQRASA